MHQEQEKQQSIEIEVDTKGFEQAASLQNDIDASIRVVDLLKIKQKNHNSQSDRKVSYNTLKEVFCNSNATFKEQDHVKDLKVWSVASIVMYLRMVDKKFDYSKPFTPDENDIAEASKDCDEFLKDFNVTDIDDLYIEPKNEMSYILY